MADVWQRTQIEYFRFKWSCCGVDEWPDSFKWIAKKVAPTSLSMNRWTGVFTSFKLTLKQILIKEDSRWYRKICVSDKKKISKKWIFYIFISMCPWEHKDGYKPNSIVLLGWSTLFRLMKELLLFFAVAETRKYLHKKNFNQR